MTIQTSLLLGYFVATYYLPEFDRVTLFFNVMAVYFLISIAPLTYWLTPVTDKFKSQALLPPKYHFHQNASHYEEEVRAKKGLAPASPEKDGDGKPKSADRSGSYCPLESQEELVKVAFSNPLFNPESEEKEQQEEKEGGGDDDGDDEELVVNPGFRFDPSATIHFYDVWVREFVMKDLGCQPLCWVKHPVTELDFPIQVAPGRVNIPQYNVPNPVNEQDKVLIDYFAAFKPGMPPPSMDDMHIDKSLRNQLRRGKLNYYLFIYFYVYFFFFGINSFFFLNEKNNDYSDEEASDFGFSELLGKRESALGERTRAHPEGNASHRDVGIQEPLAEAPIGCLP